MRLELDDVGSGVSHRLRSRRLLIDVAIGNIGRAFSVGVFALVFVADTSSTWHSSIATTFVSSYKQLCAQEVLDNTCRNQINNQIILNIIKSKEHICQIPEHTKSR